MAKAASAPKRHRSRSSQRSPVESVDAATRAALIQNQGDRRDLLCSSLALAVKIGLISLGGVSLVRLSMAYQERLDRHGELAAVVDVETNKLHGLQKRFDRLFTLGGRERLMDEQDQWIAPNRLRIIWR
ncbi:MAG: hypothetical protein CMK50_08015 [Propionibacteriaceae bacterium]|nr:hypothetical protein [Propionibacteriaceae bacterium]MBT66808.1 hypothetical protein [Synechococcus sp. NP17]